MKKVIKGVKRFKTETRESYKKKYTKLVKGQNPEALFITCADSRIDPNHFTSLEPGDLFILRNIGNMIPPCGVNGIAFGSPSVGAAIEYAIGQLKLKDIIVCGHSECGAIDAMYGDVPLEGMSNLEAWLNLQDTEIPDDLPGLIQDEALSELNRFSQINVLKQIAHLKTYPVVYKKINQGNLKLHAWWFDIEHANLYEYRVKEKMFKIIYKVPGKVKKTRKKTM